MIKKYLRFQFASKYKNVPTASFKGNYGANRFANTNTNPRSNLVSFARAGHIEESVFEVAVKMGDAANLVGGGSTDIRFIKKI